MDPITHGALGAACAQVVLHKQDRRNAWLVGALAAMAPDLDIFIQSANDPVLFLLYHRHFTHSLLFIPVGALLVTLVLMIFKRFRNNWKLTLAAAFIGYATHGVLDALTSYGTVLLWPFSGQRINWDIISIIDPFITVPLVLGVIWTYIFNNKRGVTFALLFACMVFIFNGFQHHRAITVMKTELRQQHVTADKIRAFPQLASSLHWYGFAKSNRFLVFDVNTPLLKPANSKLVKRYPLLLPDELPDYVKQSPTLLRDFNIFNWFSGGYLILVNKDPLTVADGRFLVRHDPGIALWGIRFQPDQQHVTHLVSLNLDE